MRERVSGHAFAQSVHVPGFRKASNPSHSRTATDRPIHSNAPGARDRTPASEVNVGTSDLAHRLTEASRKIVENHELAGSVHSLRGDPLREPAQGTDGPPQTDFEKTVRSVRGPAKP